MKRFLTILLLFIGQCLFAQTPKIAVFAPVYLDSAFNGEHYKLGNNYLPKQILPGLDFYNGMMAAIDSLNKEKVQVAVSFYDTKSLSKPISSIISNQELKDVQLMIAVFNTRNEVKPLADYARQLEIPLISATYPNDGGVIDNPYFYMVNSTLNAHVEAMHRFLQRYYALHNTVYVTRKGSSEELIRQTFADLNKNTPAAPLRMKTIELTDSFQTTDILPLLDSTKENLVICGTLNEAFGLRLVRSISANKQYKTSITGMPTWETMRELNKEDCRDVELIYSTPFNLPRTSKYYLYLSEQYRNKFNGRPSDMYFRGLENTYHFAKLMVYHGAQLKQNLSDKSFSLFQEYDFKPELNSKTNTLQYYENKKLYFVRKQNGIIKSVN
jgi:hypothetical protein